MASTTAQLRRAPETSPPRRLASGLVVVAACLVCARVVSASFGGASFIVASLVAGVIVGNAVVDRAKLEPGLAFAARTLLRAGIVLLGLRLSVADVIGLGVGTLAVIIMTVSITFFAVQLAGRLLGLSPGLSLLVASGFSICGNSAIASVNGVSRAEGEEVAAAVGLVTLCGTAAIFVVPTLGSLLGLSEMQLGVWTGASVQDTAQVIAVGASAGTAVLAVATAVKLTRVLFLAPIVAGVAIVKRRTQGEVQGERAPLLPLFVLGFVMMLLARTSGLVPAGALDVGRFIEQYLLAAGMVGLGSSVRLANLRRLGPKPLILGVLAWSIVGSVSLAAVHLFGV